ncbi:MAG: hypothetical protein KKF27_20860 [Gammaproteobacteria bacterium]|nr:hypothetical protein [Gammaproteobacteria bacterium]
MKDKIYTKEEAYALLKKEQQEVLKIRKVEYSAKDKEDILVEKILSSNPIIKIRKLDNKEAIKCERCRNDMELTGGGPLGSKDYECFECHAKTTIGGR